MEHEEVVIQIAISAIETFPKGTEKKVGEIKNSNKESRTHRDHNIVDIDYNTHMRSGNLRKFAVTQSPVKDHQFKPIRQKKRIMTNDGWNKTTK